MLAGEYAVLRPHGLCVAVAVGEVVRATWTPGPAQLVMRAFAQVMPVDVAAESADGLPGYVVGALRWLRAHHLPFPDQTLTLDVQGAVGGSKVGLGTSAAVTVATLGAVLDAHGCAWTPDEVAAAAREIHGTGQGAGSGYDVTTIAHGGCVQYERSPDRAAARPWPVGLHGAALFSGQSAATAPALQKAPMSTRHLDAIDAAARGLADAWTGPVAGILAALATCDAAYVAAAVDDPALVPPAIVHTRAAITAAGCVPRGSGAGGGDCVLAFSDDPGRIATLCNDWIAQGNTVVARLPADLAPIPT